MKIIVPTYLLLFIYFFFINIGAFAQEEKSYTSNPFFPNPLESLLAQFADPGTIIGEVYYDINNNGDQDAGEPGLEGVRIRFFRIGASSPILPDAFTDINGNWSKSIQPGNIFYFIQPFGDDTGDYEDNIDVTEGVAVEVNITIESNIIIDTVPTGYAFFKNITGHLYFDENGNATQDVGEANMPDVDVEIEDFLRDSETVTTDANGDWKAIVNIGEFDVEIDNSDPDFPLGAAQTEGTDPTTYPLSIDINNLPGNLLAPLFTENDGFFETGSLTGHLYFDENGNGTQESSEADMPNVDVEITDVFGVFTTLVTDINGDWSIVLPLGDATSSIVRSDPDFPTGVAQTEGEDPTTTAIVTGQTFNEIDGFYQSGILTGHLYFDENGDGTQEPSEADMPSVDVEITDVFGVVATVVTDANGDWSLVLPQGDVISSIVRSDPDFPTGATQTEGEDPTTTTIVTGQTFNEIDGFFVSGELTGHLYFDENGNGIQEPSEADMPSVDVEITDVFGVVTTLATDTNGDWSLVLPQGDAISSIVRSDPDFPTGATQTEGDDPTTTAIVTGQTVNEIDGFFVSGELTGHLYFDENGDGTQ
jgi:hypothetical protein